MFAIHGVSGQVFKGPLEDLRKLAAVTPPNRVKALTARGLLPEPDPAGHGPTPHLPAASTAGQALQTYHRVQQPPPQRRPLSVVADVMNTDPMVLADTQTVLAAWTQLAERGVGQAPVVTAQGRLVGMLTRADLLDPQRLPQPDGSVLVWRALLVQPVTALMVTPVTSVFPDTDLRRLAQALLDTGLPGLPVVDHGGGLVGFVSRADILVAVVHDPPLDLWAG
jgi:CBS domain-containing protein